MSLLSTEPSVGRSEVTASARLEVAWSAGASRIVTMRSQPPLTLRPTGSDVHLIGSAAGPLGGDRLHLEVVVGEQAHLTLRTVAASIALPGVHGSESLSTTDFQVGTAGSLRFLPEPLIAAAGCRHETRTHINLASTATLVWREELVLGRTDEAPGSIHQRLSVDRAERPLLRNDLTLGPAWPNWTSPAVLHDATVVGTLLQVGGPQPQPVDLPDATVRCATTDIDDDVWVTVAAATRHELVRHALDAAHPLAR